MAVSGSRQIWRVFSKVRSPSLKKSKSEPNSMATLPLFKYRFWQWKALSVWKKVTAEGSQALKSRLSMTEAVEYSTFGAGVEIGVWTGVNETCFAFGGTGEIYVQDKWLAKICSEHMKSRKIMSLQSQKV